MTPIQVGTRVRVVSGTCTGWVGVVVRSERELHGERPVPGREYPRRHVLRFDGGGADAGFFGDSELEAL